VVRVCKWLHTEMLKGRKFRNTFHPSLASRFAGDVATLRAQGVPADFICAVDYDRNECREIIDRLQSRGVRVFGEDIVSVVTRLACIGEIGSVFLDYMGTFANRRIRQTTQTIAAIMPRTSVLSITHLRGRDGKYEDNERENAITDIVMSSAKFPARLTQSIAYQSRDENSCGSPMLTMTFQIGGSNNVTPERLNLLRYSDDALLALAKYRIVRAGYDTNSFNQFLNNGEFQ
jgi:hypothetical protein